MHFSFAACSFRCAYISEASGQPLLRSFSMGSCGALLQKSFCGTSCLMVSLETLALDIPHTSQTLCVGNKAFGNRALKDWCCRTGGVWCWRICVWELQEPSVAMWIRQGARGVIITVEKAASWTSTNIRCLNLVFRNSMKLCNRDQKGTFKALLGEERPHPRMRFETHRHMLALTPANLFRTMFGRPCTLWNLGNWESSFRLFQKLRNLRLSAAGLYPWELDFARSLRYRKSSRVEKPTMDAQQHDTMAHESTKSSRNMMKYVEMSWTRKMRLRHWPVHDPRVHPPTTSPIGVALFARVEPLATKEETSPT